MGVNRGPGEHGRNLSRATETEQHFNHGYHGYHGWEAGAKQKQGKPKAEISTTDGMGNFTTDITDVTDESGEIRPQIPEQQTETEITRISRMGS